MAEAVVGVLIGKLGAALANQAEACGASLLDNEASALKGLFGEIHKAMDELESMKAYLHESEKFKDTNETTGIFINKIRELSFQIEDVVDEFMYKIEDDKHAGLAAKLTRRTKHVKVWHRLAHKLRDILAEIEDATKRRDRYVIPGMQEHAGSSGHHTRSTNQNLCFAREEDVVGIEHNATKLKQWLVGDLKEKSYKIATVWGMPGVGKTTLVDHVYKIVKLDFDAAAWVTVSQSYQADDLLKRIAREFGIVTDATNMEIRGLVEKIRKYLETLRDVAALTNLRTFSIDDVTSEHSLVLHSAIQNMSNLASLSIAMSNENEVLPLEQLSLPETLCKLGLTGQLEKKQMPQILSSWLHLNYLTHLFLKFSKLDESTFPSLMVLHNLCLLSLLNAYDGKTLYFSAQSFPRLRELQVDGAPQLCQVEIEQDALGSLVKLWLGGCPELKWFPRGIEYFRTLDELYLVDAADELIKILRQEGEVNECREELTKISHIRWVFFGVTGGKMWRRIVTSDGNAFAG